MKENKNDENFKNELLDIIKESLKLKKELLEKVCNNEPSSAEELLSCSHFALNIDNHIFIELADL